MSLLNRSAVLLLTLVLSPSAFAWGGRGHATICEVAPYLMKASGGKEFLSFRPQVMAHLCNVPDIYWKSLTTPEAQSGSPAHYFDADMVAGPVKDIPLDLAELSKTYTSQPSLADKTKTVKNFAQEAGTLWWRADQMLRLAAEQKSILEGAKPPENKDQEQDEKLSYNKGIYQWMVDIGVLGHFVGDVSMPYHSSSDHDGWKAGHGGIHFFYEDTVVGQFDGDLHALILKRAREMLAQPKKLTFLKGTNIERMRAMAALSYAEMAKITKLDPILKPSSETEVDGKKKKTPAERKSAKEGFKVFKNLIVEEMARSAILLATFWDESYVAIGSPDLSKYRGYRYPFTPDFIPVDYIKIEDMKKASN